MTRPDQGEQSGFVGKVDQARDNRAGRNDRAAVQLNVVWRINRVFEEFRVDKPDVGDEQADTAGDRMLQVGRDRFDDRFADFRNSDQDVDNAADEDDRQSFLPGKTKGKTDREREKGVESHARCGGIGYIGD